jgi:hypothetical protein
MDEIFRELDASAAEVRRAELDYLRALQRRDRALVDAVERLGDGGQAEVCRHTGLTRDWVRRAPERLVKRGAQINDLESSAEEGSDLAIAS